MTRSGGRILVDQLQAQGTDLAFGVPGESYLAVLDALLDSPIRFVTCRHEAGAANMAEAYGKLTGRPGVCMVTRGPGATHASVGVHTAFQDSTPLLLLVGQVDRGHAWAGGVPGGRLRAHVRPAGEVGVRDPRRGRGSRSSSLAPSPSPRRAGPGRSCWRCPRTCWSSEAEVADAPPRRARAGASRRRRPRPPARAARAEPSGRSCSSAGSRWTAEAAADLQAFCEASTLPVGASFRCQDYVDNRSPRYAGHVGIGTDPALAPRVREADLLLVVGARLGEIHHLRLHARRRPPPAADARPRSPRPGGDRPRLPAGARRSSRRRRSSRPRCARSSRSTATLGGVDGEARTPTTRPAVADPRCPARSTSARSWRWLRERAARRRDRDQRRRQLLRLGAPLLPLPPLPHAARPDERRDGLRPPGRGRRQGRAPRPARGLLRRRRRLPDVRPGARDRRPARPPDRRRSWSTTACTGRSACTRSASIPGRVSGTDLVNPDFAAFARAFGAHGETVERTDDFAAAFERALAAGRPAVLSLPVDPEAITPRTTLTALRESALRG